MNHDRVQMFRRKLDKLTLSDYHGLNSPGLTCYLNSVLQVLFMTEDFRSAIKRCCTADSTTMDRLLENLFAALNRCSARTHSFIKTLGITDAYEQRDAAEYFEKILCLTSPEASKIFKGELHHKTTCVECKKRNDSRTSFWVLPLAMENSSRQTYSVERGLKTFFRKEQVCGDNKIYCDRCSKKQDADIDCEMTQTPPILTLLLKRFTFDFRWKRYVKLHCKVDVPQTVHMENCSYDLYALVNHFGDLSGGHYTAEIKSFETGEWYHFNDDDVERIRQPPFGTGNSSVRSRTVYLLMYRKRKTDSVRRDEVDQDDQHAPFDTEAEGGCGEMTDESGSGGENLNGDMFKMSNSDSNQQKNCDSLKKRLNPRGITWDCTDQDNIAVMAGTKSQSETEGVRNTKVVAAAEESRSIRQRTEPAVCVNAAESGRSFQVSSNCCSPSSAQVCTGASHSNCRLNEPSRSRNLKNQQPPATAGEDRTRQTTQTVTKGVESRVRKTKNCKRVEETAKRVPWRINVMIKLLPGPVTCDTSWSETSE
ncbi:ubiquitin carboxyl-terminal hydrolase 47-like [Echeneis naucrates]|uniref:ubiquitin carboxyl-terminal hydrolase 47-like n=1 Tax=Echeneis naucrates TaxID=173247 RepID=UPI0011144806|nr:ubiquitin carboxyl-terminal hydrolase 47-like [Echeneis naucrates]